jgi:uncharacterized protein (TIGR02599 family)
MRFRRSGFTIIELLLSTSLIALIMVLLLGTVDQTQRLWQRSTSKAAQFQAARAAFESMTRRLSQATLNTYYRAHDIEIGDSKGDFSFRRQSELQFLSMPTQRVIDASPKLLNPMSPTAAAYPTHSVFFFAPVGYTEEAGLGNDKEVRRFRSLDSLLSACGYFIEFSDDLDRPPFLSKMSPPLPPKFRFHLMEMTVPTERMTAYQRPVDDSRFIDPRVFDELGQSNQYYGGCVDKNRRPIRNWRRPLWMKQALVREFVPGGEEGNTYRFKHARTMADNVVALIVLPKLAEKDRIKPGGTTVDPLSLDLAPRYEYDSWRILSGGTAKEPITGVSLDNSARDNLLPPILQVTLVAIDEPSAIRISADPTNIPTWTQGLFQTVLTEADYAADMATLEENLRGEHGHPKASYRIFTTDVVIRGSKWSRDPG